MATTHVVNLITTPAVYQHHDNEPTLPCLPVYAHLKTIPVPPVDVPPPVKKSPTPEHCDILCSALKATKRFDQ